MRFASPSLLFPYTSAGTHPLDLNSSPRGKHMHCLTDSSSEFLPANQSLFTLRSFINRPMAMVVCCGSSFGGRGRCGCTGQQVLEPARTNTLTTALADSAWDVLSHRAVQVARSRHRKSDSWRTAWHLLRASRVQDSPADEAKLICALRLHRNPC